MEQEIILEGIHAMLEEIRDDTKKSPEVETIKSELNAIEKICNEFAGQKFVTDFGSVLGLYTSEDSRNE